MLYQKQIMKTNYDVIIIGSGISGLTCGARLAAEGISVLVLEQHVIPGGAAAMFKRGDFCFEGGGHRVSGIRNPGGVLYELFEKIGVKLQVNPIDPSYGVRIGDKFLEASLDIEQYTSNLIRLFPEEEKNIQRFIADMKKMAASLQYLSGGKANPIVLLTRHRHLIRNAGKTTAEVIKRYFQNSELISFVTAIGNYTTLPPEEQSYLAFTNIWAAHHLGEGMNLIQGGTRVMVDALVDYIDNHNGQVVVAKDVAEIVIEKGKAVGVRTKHGERIEGRVIVSAVSNEETYLKLIDAKWLKAGFVDKIKREKPSGALFQLFLGIKELDGQGLENVTTFVFSTVDRAKHYKKIADWDLDAMCEGGIISVEGRESSPEGTRSINISALCPFDHPEHWFLRDNDKRRYEQFKEEIAQRLIESVAKYIPDLHNRIITKSTATPLTVFRYTRATKGGLHGLAHTVAQSGKRRGNLKSPIKNLYRTGQYVFPGGGIAAVAISSLLCFQLIMKEHFSSGVSLHSPKSITQQAPKWIWSKIN